MRIHPKFLTLGVRVAPYASDAQREVMRASGFMGVYERFIAPLQLRPKDPILWHYPFALQWPASLTQIEDSPDLWQLASECESKDNPLILYLSNPTMDMLPGGPDQFNEIIAKLPTTARVAFDALASTENNPFRYDILGVAMTRKVYGEPTQFTYSAFSQMFSTLENSDHYQMHKDDPQCIRIPQAHSILEHHRIDYTPSKKEAVKAFVQDTFLHGYNCFVQAEPLVANTPTITLSEVDPRV